jgi:hypothetical protein
MVFLGTLFMNTLLIFAITLISSTLFAGDQVPPRLGAIPKAKSHDSIPRKKTETLLPTRASDADIPVITRTRTPKVHAKRLSPKKDSKRKDNNFLSQAASVITKNLSPKPGHTRKRSYSDTMPSMRVTTTSNTTQKPYPFIKANSTGEVRKRVAFTISPKQARRTPQTQKVRQSLDETRLLDNKATLIVIMKQRVPLKQRDYTYGSCLAWSNCNTKCIQLLVAKKEEQKEVNNDKEEAVEWHRRPYIAFLHTFLETIPFDMSTPLAKKMFPMLEFPEKLLYTVKAHYNEDTNSFDLAVSEQQSAPEERVIQIKEEIAEERRKARREFFGGEEDLLAKIEAGIKKRKELMES